MPAGFGVDLEIPVGVAPDLGMPLAAEGMPLVVAGGILVVVVVVGGTLPVVVEERQLVDQTLAEVGKHLYCQMPVKERRPNY